MLVTSPQVQLHPKTNKQASMMAARSRPVGYECEFADQDPDYFCKQCKHVASGSNIASCCAECGASFERNDSQMIQCEFSYAGCEAEFSRDHQKEHMEQNTQKHLALVAAATLRISQEQQQTFEHKLQELQRAFEKKLGEQQEDFHKQQRMLEEKLEEKDHQIKILEEQQNRSQIEIRIPPYYITLSNFRDIKARGSNFRSQLMYTHTTRHKFYLVLEPNGPEMGEGHGTYIAVVVYSVKGDYEDEFNLPARFTITLELLNQHRDQDHYKRDIECEVTRESIYPSSIGHDYKFIPHVDLEWNAYEQTQYLKNDCLKFRITEIVVH